jgi:Protein of unknown function (DUF2510)
VESRTTPSGWYADPQGRYEFRYFNGVQWTSDVAVDGQRYVDSMANRPPPEPHLPHRRRGMAITSMVTAMAGVLVGWVPFIFVFAACSAVAAIVFGVLGLKAARRHDGYGRGFAVTGLVLAPIALAVCVGGFFFTRAVVHEFRDYVDPGPHEVFVDQPCTVAGGRATLTGKIHNLDDREHDYRILVKFSGTGDSTSSTAIVADVGADQTTAWSASADISGGSITCSVTDVFGPMPFDIEPQN